MVQNEGFIEIVRQTQIPFQRVDGLDGQGLILGHHEEFTKLFDESRFSCSVNLLLLVD